MFERDVQGVMDEYLAGSITERDLRQASKYVLIVSVPLDVELLVAQSTSSGAGDELGRGCLCRTM